MQGDTYVIPLTQGTASWEYYYDDDQPLEACSLNCVPDLVWRNSIGKLNSVLLDFATEAKSSWRRVYTAISCLTDEKSRTTDNQTLASIALFYLGVGIVLFPVSCHRHYKACKYMRELRNNIHWKLLLALEDVNADLKEYGINFQIIEDVGSGGSYQYPLAGFQLHIKWDCRETEEW